MISKIEIPRKWHLTVNSVGRVGWVQVPQIIDDDELLEMRWEYIRQIVYVVAPLSSLAVEYSEQD